MRVLCAGLMVCDLLIKPVDSSTLEMDTCTADALDIRIGGDACNVAVNLQEMGVSVSLMSAVGEDFFGRYIVDCLKEKNLSTDLIFTRKEETARSAVLISNAGERCFVSRKGACHKLHPSDVTDKILKGFDILYIGSVGDLPEFEGKRLADLLMRARRLGLKTVLDVSGEVDGAVMNNLKEAFAHLDVFLPSIREARNMAGAAGAEECLKILESEQVRTVCIKMGEEGSGLLKNGKLHVIPPYRADCIDTTGAGDAFVSGFIAGITLGYDPEKCCALGNYVGSKTVEQIGAQVKLEKLETIVENLTVEV